MKRFEFNFKDLTLEDQKIIYKHLFPKRKIARKINQASDLEQIMALFDEKENKMVYPLAYLAAMLAHEVAYVKAIPVENYGKYYFNMDVRIKEDFELGNDFDMNWYKGLNGFHKGAIALFDNLSHYELEELEDLFKKYSFIS